MGKRLTDRVTWVGKVDWELKRFHGDELSTHRGSSYNSYLIRDKKNVLIDTSWLPYSREFVNNLKKEIDLNKIDYIVMCHNEIDHSGALVDLMREIPDTPIYCTAKGEAIIRGHYHQDWNFVNVKTGDTLELGDTTLTFIEATMLHWPDTMFCYLSGEEILSFLSALINQITQVIVLIVKAVGQREIGQDRRMVNAVDLHLVQNLVGVLQGFRNVGEHLIHLLLRLEPLLLAVHHHVLVGELLAR